MFVNGKQVWESSGEGILVRNVSLMTAAGEAGSASPASGNIEIIVEEMVAGDSNQMLPVAQEARLEETRKNEKEFAKQVSDREAPITSTQRDLLEKGEDTETLNSESVEKKNPTDETSPEPSTPTDEKKENSGTTQTGSEQKDSEQTSSKTPVTKKLAAKINL